MADIESNVKVNIDTSDALAQLKLLQQQISAFQQAMRKAGADNALAARQMQQNLVNSVNATGKFQANIQTIQTSAERFTTSLEKNKLTMGEYFRYAGGASKTFGKLFKAEFETINQVARERVKELQTQYIKLGRDANGAMKAIAVKPLALDMENLGTKTQMAAQRQQLFNQLMTQGSTNLLNFGKNTQWAGRQLMVGFTVPLTLMGSAAAKAYMEIEKASISFKRVYGDINTTSDETEKMARSVRTLAEEFTKYGASVADTMDMAAKAAAMGKTGADLLAQVSQAAKLSVLGQVDQNQALETTISLTNAFGVSAADLSKNIDFLNAVENQTVTSIEDLTIAIPKAAPVIQQLGGDVEDLTFFLTAMKEGGINASEGANALKSGLASLINPSKKASDFMASFGISIKGIVEGNKGDVKGTVIGMAKALDTLDPLNRARAIEQMFGKFQFSRISTLFQNVVKEGSQAQTVAGLAKQTAEELSVLSEREMKKISDSPMYKFQKSIQDIQAKLAPVGEAFLKAVTPIMEFVGKVLDGFNNLSEGSKQFITILVTAVAGIGPLLLMTFGLVANGVANIMKLFTNMKSFINKTTKPSDILGEQTGYMNTEQLRAAAIAASLDQAHAKLRQTFTSETQAVQDLTAAYRNAVQAQQAFAGVPGVPTGNPNATPNKYANGVSMVPGPAGAGDIVPALLSPGEAVIPARSAKKYAPVIRGMIAGNLPGFENGTTGAGMRQSVYGPLTQKQTEGLGRTGLQLKEISDEVMAGPYGKVQPTDFGTQISPTSGHSFPAFSVGGIYQKPDGTKVFVKPQMDLTSALAEVRGTTIARDVHGLVAPKQEIRVMMDPTDPENQRRFIVLESALDERIANIPNQFSNSEYFTQLVASLLRGDKDLGIGNLGGNILADVGTAGVFGRASGKRALGSAVNSMEEQAIINLLGVKGGAKRFFAEATAEQVSKMKPGEYDAAMKAEMARVAPKLQATIAGFGNMSPEEKAAYQAMQQRLQAGMSVDWSKYQVMHSAVPPKKFELGGFAGLTQASHTQRELDKNDPSVISQIEKVYPGIKDEHLQYITVLGNLTADLPTWVNQRLIPTKGGIVPPIFQKVWNSIHGKFNSSAKAAGVPANLNGTLAQIEESIGNTTVRVAAGKNVIDPILADGTREALFSSVSMGGDSAEVANRLLERSNTVGSIRADLGKNANGKLRQLLASGIAEFAPNGKDVVFSGTKIKIGRFALASSSSKPEQRAEQESKRASWIASGAVPSALPEELKLRGSSLPPGSFRRSLTGISSYDELLASISGVSDPNVFDEKAFIGAQKFAKGTPNVGATGKPKASVFDIDDTLLDLSSFMAAHKAENDKLPEGEKKKWYKEVAKDPKGIPAGLAALKAAQQRGNKILLMTARPDFYEPYTVETLQKLGIDMNGIKLIARKDKDYRKPEQMKYDKTSKFMKYYDIEEFYDDMDKTRGAVSLLGINAINPLKLSQGVFSVPGPKGAGDVVPAMLSPGEAVIPAEQAGKYRPMISQMISGNLPGYFKGTAGVGMNSVFSSETAMESGKPLNVNIVKDETGKSGKSLEVLQKDSKVTILTRQQIEEQMSIEDDVYRQLLEKEKELKLKHVLTEEERRLIEENKQIMLRKEEAFKLEKNVKEKEKRGLFTRNETTGKIQGAMYGLSAAAGLASTVPGAVGESAQQMLPVIGAATAAMSVIPGYAGMIVAAGAGLVTAYMQVQEKLNKIRDEALALGTAMGSSTKSINKFAEFAKTVTGSQAMDKRRETSAGNFFNVVQGKTTFGESYMKSDAGKELVKSVGASIKGGGLDQAKSMITNQLSTAIASGAMSPAQARSIASSLGAQLGDMSLGIEVAGRITDLVGPSGEDLRKEPLEIRMRLVADSVEQFKKQAGIANANAGDVGKNVGSTAAGLGIGAGAGLVAGGAVLGGASIAAGLGATGMVAGLAAAGSVVPVIGTVIGALVGFSIAAVQIQGDIAKNAGYLQASLGSALSVQQQMVDSLSIDYEKRIAAASAAGDVLEVTRLQTQSMADQAELLQFNKEQTQEMYNILNSQGQGIGFAFNAQIANLDTARESLKKAFEGTGQEVQQKLAQEQIDSMSGSAAQKTMLFSAVAQKQIGLNQIGVAKNVFGNDQAGADTLQKLMENSPTELNRTLGLAGSMGAEEQKKFVVDMSLKDPVQAKIMNDAVELAQKTTGVFFGEKKTAEAIMKFAVENPEKMLEFQENVAELKNVSGATFDITVAQKILGPNLAAALGEKSVGAFFKKYNKQNKIVFLSQFQQTMTMLQQGDKDMLASYNAWNASNGMKKTYADYAAWQSDRTVTSQGVDNTGVTSPNANLGGGGGPSASFLDPYVESLRNASNFQQKLTVGFAASLKALRGQEGALTKFAGLAMRLKSYGADSNFIEAVLGGDQADIDKVINRATGKLTKAGEDAIRIAKKVENAKIGMAYVLADESGRLQKDSELYNAGLEVISAKEKKINEKYDARIKTLDEIGKIQDKNNQRQQDSMSLADALSKGDIAAAARAAMQAKQNEQKAALEDAKSSIENARKSELEAITVRILGQTVTRDELEARIAANSEKIAIAKKDELDKQIQIGKNAVITANASAKTLANGLKIAGLKSTIGGGTGGTSNSGGDPKPKPKPIPKNAVLDADPRSAPAPSNAGKTAADPVTTGILDGMSIPTMVKTFTVGNYIKLPAGVYLQGIVDNGSTANITMSSIKGPGINIKATGKVGKLERGFDGKLTPLQKFAKGGMVYANNGLSVEASKYALGTDTIPAMLTPGEFVMSKPAVDRLGTEALSSMNNGTSAGESVYNYSITVNANSSDASGIADAVLREIQRIDSRRIRSSNI